MDGCKPPAAERGQDRVSVVQLSSAFASTAGFASRHWWKFSPACVSGA